ncbi:heme oxygenase (biliverdin-producing) [Gordonia sp. (in: high G+C Gram-positive bacteria)]|uniref:biliverdin-producing heme oxygenase n=1 Tax=Gordonia sp. (in: high G+C Gram-positive bacteria) TaxID=84139 RepID=UPI003C75E55B
MATTTPTDVASNAQLSVQMKQGSQLEHEQAENSKFVEDLLGGRIDAAGYLEYLQRLRIVYAALEEASRELADDPQVRQIHDIALERVGTIDADLAHWAERAGVDLTPVSSEAAEAYAARIADAKSWGGLLVAHHYTRYLGDLSGGQAIGAILDRTFELGGQGVALYKFDLIEKNKPYKDEYRRKLDTIGDGLTPDERARIVDEVKAAFVLNHDLFAELNRVLSAK